MTAPLALYVAGVLTGSAVTLALIFLLVLWKGWDRGDPHNEAHGDIGSPVEGE